MNNAFVSLDYKLANALKDLKSNDNESDYAIGNGKIYLRDWAIEHLYQMVFFIIAQCLMKIVIARRVMKKRKASATIIQAMVRGSILWNMFKKIKKAVICIQCFVKFNYLANIQVQDWAFYYKKILVCYPN